MASYFGGASASGNGNAWLPPGWQNMPSPWDLPTAGRYGGGFTPAVSPAGAVVPGTVPGAGAVQSGASPTPGGFILNPQPQGGQGAFGAVPGALGLPDPYADLQRPLPGLPGLNDAASSALLAKLHGEISPSTQAAIQDAAARFGVSSGMPGSGLAGSRSLRDLGRLSEDQQAAGLAAYGPFVGAVSNTQTVNPALQNEIALQNAVNAAAPNPTQAASYARQLFDEYLNRLSQSSRGPAAGTSGSQFGANPAGGTVRMPTAPFSNNAIMAGGGALPQYGGASGVVPNSWNGSPGDLFSPGPVTGLDFAGGSGLFNYGSGADFLNPAPDAWAQTNEFSGRSDLNDPGWNSWDDELWGAP